MPSGLQDIGKSCYSLHKMISFIPICSVLWDLGILAIFFSYFRRIRLNSFNVPIMMPSDPGNELSNDAKDVSIQIIRNN